MDDGYFQRKILINKKMKKNEIVTRVYSYIIFRREVIWADIRYRQYLLI